MKKLLAVLLVVLSLTACGAPASIDGDWALDMEGETVIWSFSEGKITFEYNGVTAPSGGSYRYADGVLELTLDEEWAEYDSYDCTISGNKMTITQEGVEDELVFTRAED